MTDHCFAKLDCGVNPDQIETADLKFVAELFPDPNDELHITKLYREGTVNTIIESIIYRLLIIVYY